MVGGIGGFGAADNAVSPIDGDMAFIAEEGNGDVGLRGPIFSRFGLGELHRPADVAVLLAQLRRLLLLGFRNLARLDGGLLPVRIALFGRRYQRCIDDLAANGQIARFRDRMVEPFEVLVEHLGGNQGLAEIP